MEQNKIELEENEIIKYQFDAKQITLCNEDGLEYDIEEIQIILSNSRVIIKVNENLIIYFLYVNTISHGKQGENYMVCIRNLEDQQEGYIQDDEDMNQDDQQIQQENNDKLFDEISEKMQNKEENQTIQIEDNYEFIIDFNDQKQLQQFQKVYKDLFNQATKDDQANYLNPFELLNNFQNFKQEAQQEIGTEQVTLKNQNDVNDLQQEHKQEKNE
ncbi:hypothetical protein PPERSA_09238 [Pseudocohnilembus persalinus]|uniref:Uncharacterized protein n=1 Tax=Pseudocohnilembus persalinus TaxID=266149 RepID=A0A0V0QM23_PSEPJ|nr:hypothetical protein PPERSA_09238 [Pseudocohnilembus persalinus]|eukprot:KRX03226.1 hypothetical protein PPERSA_09238 [Pseudocohnilembus persalinus]